MSSHLEGKAVVVTGGGRGIGRAIALAAAEAGAGSSSPTTAAPLIAMKPDPPRPPMPWSRRSQAAGGEAVAAAVDISTMAGRSSRGRRRRRLLRAARCHGLLARASPSLKYLWEPEEQEWDDVINVHLKGHFSCAQGSGSGDGPPAFRQPHLLRRAGRSTACRTSTAYATAKAGILGFTWSTANASDGSVSPRTVWSQARPPGCPTTSTATLASSPTRLGDAMRSDLADGTYRDPANVAPFAVYLMSTALTANQRPGLPGPGLRGRSARDAPLRARDHEPRPWDVDTLAERVPAELGPDLQPLPMPWPEPEWTDDIEFTA